MYRNTEIIKRGFGYFGIETVYIRQSRLSLGLIHGQLMLPDKRG